MTACRIAGAAALLSVVLFAVELPAEKLTAAQGRGKHIYMEGKGQEKITVFLAGAGISRQGSGPASTGSARRNS